MHILTSTKPRLRWVVGNVATQELKLLLTAHQMIKPILLPEPSSATKLPVYLRRRVVLPRLTLYKHLFFVTKGRQHMRVVGHYDEISQLVTFAVEMLETGGNDLGQPWTLEHTFAAASVQFRVPTRRECPMELARRRRGASRRSARCQPLAVGSISCRRSQRMRSLRHCVTMCRGMESLVRKVMKQTVPACDQWGNRRSTMTTSSPGSKIRYGQSSVMNLLQSSHHAK